MELVSFDIVNSRLGFGGRHFSFAGAGGSRLKDCRCTPSTRRRTSLAGRRGTFVARRQGTYIVVRVEKERPGHVPRGVRCSLEGGVGRRVSHQVDRG